jgi:hypothetical protein
MTEIQLRRIVDRNAQEGSEQQSDGDERMVKHGESISKFSKEAMTLGDDVYAYEGNAPAILQKVYDLLYDHYVVEERVFPVKNGAPRIMTKYKDIPYSYELQPEYAAGNKKFPCVKKDHGLDGEKSFSPSYKRIREKHSGCRRLRTSIMHIKIGDCPQICTWTNERRPRSWFQSLRERPYKQMS